MKPIDIEMKKFKKTIFGGFDTDDVNEFLDDITRSYEKIYKENALLERQVIDLNKQMDYYKTMESTLQKTMVRAEQVAEETKDKATLEAEQIILDGTFKTDQMLEEAREEVYMVRENLLGLKKQYETAKSRMKELLESQLESLDSDVMAVEEFKSIPEEPLVEAVEEETIEIPEEDIYYTKEYQIIDEKDVI